VKRPRLTIRRLMVLVALAAIALGIVGRFQRLSVTFQQKAEAYQKRVVFTYRMTGIGDSQIPSPNLERNSWTMAMMAKYRWAARYPWFPVAPDPPEPE
jgi:hypothetical protein